MIAIHEPLKVQTEDATHPETAQHDHIMICKLLRCASLSITLQQSLSLDDYNASAAAPGDIGWQAP
jgi:hypothetical protein